MPKTINGMSMIECSTIVITMSREIKNPVLAGLSNYHVMLTTDLFSRRAVFYLPRYVNYENTL